MSRAAIFAFGATLIGATAMGCGDSDEDTGSGGAGGTAGTAGSGGSGGSGGSAGSATGGTAGANTDGSAGSAGAVAPPYGFPPGDDGGPQPLYGAAP